MAKKKKAAFFCTDCGHESIGFLGKCPGCKEFNTMVEAPDVSTSPGTSGSPSGWTVSRMKRPVVLSEIEEHSVRRIPTGTEEFDFVLGGGIVPGSFTLLGGEPGVGKSTVLTQIADSLNANGFRPLYVSGEESPSQVRLRSARLGKSALDIHFLAETEISAVLRQAETFGPDVLVIDSIQTLFDQSVDGAPGGIKQLNRTGFELLQYAKTKGVAVFIIGHVTKEGGIAGPRMLEHMVDTVLFMENAGDGEHRIVRTMKNRFGSDQEIGVFRMTEAGLFPVSNPSEVFLADRASGTPGSAVAAVMEGSRPLLVEVQGLVSVSAYGSPQRVATGFNRKRLAILLAVLEKRGGLPFSQFDVFLNVVGGMTLTEPAADAAVVAALASSVLDKPLPDDAVFLGEIGLSGEIRRVPRMERRLSEASSLGFGNAYASERGAVDVSGSEIALHRVRDIRDLIHRTVGPVPETGASKDGKGKGREKVRKGGNRVALDVE